MCWVALDRGVRLAPLLGEHADAGRWAAARDEARATVLEEAWDERRGALTGTLGGGELDASVLLLPLVGFVDAADERMASKIAVLEQVLGDDGLLRRLESRTAEGAFLPVTFWLSACHAMAGDTDRARAALRRAAACANDLGLLAEMADPATGEPQGNVPQALSHVGLITAARCVAEAERKVSA
jgi:GH15 family glucan-1,4-alpha-glucosidase